MADYLGKKIKFNIEDNDLQKIRFNKTYGESQQATRSGKNFLENTGVSNTSNGVTFTINDDKTILVDGNNDGTANSRFIINNYSLKAGTYILNGCPSGGSSTTYRLAIQKTSDWSILGLDTGSGSEQFTIDEATNIQVAIFIQKGQTISNLLFKPMIRLSSIIDDTYEQYGVMPSPDYRSKIENLEGKNKFNYLWFDTTKEVDWTAYQSISNVAKAIPIFIGKGKVATFSSNVPLVSGDNLLYAINDLTKGTNLSFALGKTQTIKANNEGYVYVGYLKSRTNYDKVKDGTYYVQVEEGTVATPYVPYNSLEFKDEGKNLFNIDTIIENLYIIAQNGDRGNSSFTNTSDYIPINANEKYVITYDYTSLLSENARAVCFFDKNKNYVNGKTYSVTSKKVDMSSDFDGYVVFSYDKNCTDIMFSKEEQSIQYEPYKSQTAYFPLSEGQKLMEGSYLADDGIHHIRKQYTFTGNEVITLSNRQYENCVCFYINNPNLINKQNNYITKEMCSHFAYDSLAYKENRDVECITDNTGVPYRLIMFQILKTRLTSIDEAGCKAYLSEQYANGTPVIVEYELAEEEIVPYTEIQQEAREKLRHFKGLNGENNITAQGTMTSTLDLTLYNVAEEDFDIYISKKGYFGALKYDINNLIDFMESNIPSIAEATESSVKIAGRDGDISLNTVYEPLPFEIVCYTEDNLTPEEKIIEEQKITSLLNSIKNQTKTFFMEREKKFYKVKYSGNLSVVRYPKHLKFTIPLKSSESYAMNFEESEIIGNGTKVSNTIKDTGAIFTIKGPAIKPIISLNNYQMKYNENILEGNSLIINSEDSTITHITSAGVKTNAMRAYNHEFPKIKNGENQLAVSSGIDDEKQVNVKWYDLKI